MEVLQNLLDSLYAAPLLVQISVAMVIVMLLSILTLIIVLKSIRSLLNIKDYQISKYKKEYEGLLIDYLYSGNEDTTLSARQESIIRRIAADIKFIPRRKSIITMLSSIMDEISGEMAESVKILYRKTGLVNFALLRLKDKRWHIVAKAISELRRFEVYEAQEIIAEFLNHPNEEVRKETQLYLVHLFRFNGLSFLDDLKEPLSEWQQFLLIETLMNFEIETISNLEPWLTSSNISVVMFALKLTKIFNQFEMKDSLIELLKHQEKDVREYAIKVLNRLFGYEADQLLRLNSRELELEEHLAFLEKLK